jgi:uncharacterized membrane protein (UPF0127 family)
MRFDRLKFFIKENIRLFLGLTVVIFFTILIISLLLGRGGNTQVSVNDQVFKVSVADSEVEKQVGLSNTQVLGTNEGMLFLFDKPDFYSFWMNNMKFPIDIIFINGNRVISVVSNAPAPSSSNEDLQIYKPSSESDKVLEINAGLAEKYNIKEGSVININNL